MEDRSVSLIIFDIFILGVGTVASATIFLLK